MEIGIQYVSFGPSHTSFENAVNTAATGKLLFGFYDPDNVYLVIGFTRGDYAAFFGFTYNSDDVLKKLCYKYGGTWMWI